QEVNRERIQAARKIGANGVVLCAGKAEHLVETRWRETGRWIELAGVQNLKAVPSADHLGPQILVQTVGMLHRVHDRRAVAQLEQKLGRSRGQIAVQQNG